MTLSNITWSCKSFSELSTAELYAFFVLRIQVFVIEQDCPYQDADGKDQNSYHLAGYDEQGTLLAYLRIVEKGISYPDHISIGRVLTDETTRGTGLGKEMMKRSLEFIEVKFGKTPVKISAQTYLIKWYGSFGFEPIGEEYLEDDLPHIAMILNWKK